MNPTKPTETCGASAVSDGDRRAAAVGADKGRGAAVAEKFRAALPTLLLTAALAWVVLLNSDPAHYYDAPMGWDTLKNLAIAENISPRHNFRLFMYQSFEEDGEPYYEPYYRFPVGGFALIKLAILPFGENMLAKTFAARMLMLAFLAAAAYLAYYSVARIASSRWIALTATLIAFSSYYVLRYGNEVSNEFTMDLFMVMLTFHGMVVFIREGRFRQLLVKSCIALLIGWHVYALLAPFIALGIGNEVIQAIKARRERPLTISALTSIVWRSRYVRLSIVAVLFGAAMLAFNLINEYDLLSGETSLLELPSAQRIIIKIQGERQQVEAQRFTGLAFIQQQFRRITGASIPYVFTQWRGYLLYPTTDARTMLFIAIGVCVAIILAFGLLFAPRDRVLLASLALPGIVWLLVVNGQAAHPHHDYEAIYHVGIPLTIVTMVFSWIKERSGSERIFLVAAPAALAIFTISAYQVMAKGADEDLFNRREAIISDLANIRKIVEGRNVLVANPMTDSPGMHRWWAHSALRFLLSGSRIRDLRRGMPDQYDFAVTLRRPERTSPSLTPDNEIFFLYERMVPTEVTSEFLDFVVSSHAPAARSAYDVYSIDGALVYVREPCGSVDAKPIIFLHVFPERTDDLPGWRKTQGFDNLDFRFPMWGASFDGACIARVPLPEYEVKAVRTGDWGEGELLWDAAFSLDAEHYRAAYDAAALRQPDARAEFDLYLDQDMRSLTYVKEPCAAADVADPFFLHVTPTRADSLPEDLIAFGFDNLDFDFRLNGAVFEGKCAAKVALPRYSAASVRTGQFVPGSGEAWSAAISFPR